MWPVCPGRVPRRPTLPSTPLHTSFLPLGLASPLLPAPTTLLHILILLLLLLYPMIFFLLFSFSSTVIDRYIFSLHFPLQFFCSCCFFPFFSLILLLLPFCLNPIILIFDSAITFQFSFSSYFFPLPPTFLFYLIRPSYSSSSIPTS